VRPTLRESGRSRVTAMCLPMHWLDRPETGQGWEWFGGES
jgi:hypothetical protein